MRKGSIEARAALHASEVVKSHPSTRGAASSMLSPSELASMLERAFMVGYHAGIEDANNPRKVR